MTTKTAAAVRKPRADAQRNRERLMDVAKAAFAALGADVPFEEIARRAKVGIGTLYRHFPNRDALVEAVYAREVTQLSDAATQLLKTKAPLDALHTWLNLFIDYMATKKVVLPVLSLRAQAKPSLYENSGAVIRNATEALIRAAIAAGEVRPDVTPDDIMRALTGLAAMIAAPDWKASTLRLIDIFITGLRRQPMPTARARKQKPI